MTNGQRQTLSRETGCEIRFDTLSRQLYATDASIYQLEPLGVAFPKSPEEASHVIQAARAEGIPVVPRGAGTGLAGGAIGRGLIVDYSRYNRGIHGYDAATETVRVDAGVVLDRLNAFLRPYGRRFGPDVATGSRATLGGMIANNSSGSHVPLYGTTIDHVESLELVLADGRQVTVGTESPDLASIHEDIDRLIESHRDAIDARMPPGLMKRWPGYGLDRWLRQGPGLHRILGGSEGTLAIVAGATLRTVPLPERVGLAAICFASVQEAMEATVELLAYRPAAIEHIDRVLFDQTKGQFAFRRARALLELDTKPCEAILLVEFFDEVEEPLGAIGERDLGLRIRTFTDPEDMQAVWDLRKAGLALLTGCVGRSKPIAGIEDACVPPDRLPAYVQGLRELMAPLGLRGSFYGHAASGLLHVRPAIDLHSAEDIAKFRHLACDVSALVKEFKGSLCGEHGVGIARTEFMEEQLGPELVQALRAIKALFDPNNVFNPGKVLPDGDFRIDTNLRWGAGYDLTPPFDPVLRYAFKDGSFVGNLEQCNGNGACRKLSPTMCPTFLVTGEELMSTRGRANAIRAALDGRLAREGLWSPELDEALKWCLSCKACTTECPSNVNLTALKSELLHARHRETGVPLRDWVLSRVDLLGAFGTVLPGAANAFNRLGPTRRLLESALGLAAERPLPAFARQRFDRWFAKRPPGGARDRGKVILWDDCFTRYYEPNIGRAAVEVLEAAGFEVILPKGRACCGRPAYSLGRLDVARGWAAHNAALLGALDGDARVVALEPSCFSMLWDDYRELGVEGAEAVRGRTELFEQFMARTFADAPDALRLREWPGPIAVHAHCHADALVDASVNVDVLGRIPGAAPSLLDTACCGMAGSYGATAEKYEMSVRLGELLLAKLNAYPEETRIVASGTSCRQQITHLSDRKPLHIAEALAASVTGR